MNIKRRTMDQLYGRVLRDGFFWLRRVHKRQCRIGDNNKSIKKPGIINKKLTSEETCPISLETINEGDIYIECKGCSQPFHESDLLTWLKSKTSCPKCRADSNFTSRYINQ